jgi:LuxR family quorum-sensing system transcriptional regulator CciR
MGILMAGLELVSMVMAADSPEELLAALTTICTQMGFQYFALAHHIDTTLAPEGFLRLHNCPARWVDYLDAHGPGLFDPIHQAGHLAGMGLRWSRLPETIALSSDDRRIMALGRAHGIGHGFTIPTHIPGEIWGSCTFANEVGRPLPEEALPLAELVGAFACERARRLWSVRQPGTRPPPDLTKRQRDCVLWAARGKSDWEIGRILGISEQTVIRHLKHARERYDVQKRTLLAVRALFDGTISFIDVLKR